MEKLLYAHQDLLDEFTHFLPNVTRPSLIPIVPASPKPSFGQMSRETCIRYSHKEIVVNVMYHVLYFCLFCVVL